MIDSYNPVPLSSTGSGLGLGALSVPESSFIMLSSSSEKLLSTSDVAVTVVATLSHIDTVRPSSSCETLQYNQLQ